MHCFFANLKRSGLYRKDTNNKDIKGAIFSHFEAFLVKTNPAMGVRERSTVSVRSWYSPASVSEKYTSFRRTPTFIGDGLFKTGEDVKCLRVIIAIILLPE